MIIVLLFTLYVCSSGFTGNIYKKLAIESHNRSMSSFMPSVWCMMLAAVFGIASLFGDTIALKQIPIAVGAGVCIFAAIVILIESMKTNSMSISIIIMNLNFIITVALSSIFLKEKVAIIQLIGMIASVAVILILNLKGDEKTGKKGAVFLPLVACIANGLVNFLIKLNDVVKTDNSASSTNAFNAIMYFSAAIAAIIAGIIFGRKQTGKNIVGVIKKKTLPFMVLMGLCNGVCFYMAGILAGKMNAAAQFTIVTAASIMISLIIGIIFQKEKFTWKVGISLVCCAVALLCQMTTLI
ncbi:MAG: hypothetical protein E7385_03445 [Ruminococcaceae bacterium]|nr:hypothetical protein [Oscillospiraceae bacterium]